VHYTTSCNIQSSALEDGQNNCPKYVELIGIINKPLLLHLVGSLYYFLPPDQFIVPFSPFSPETAELLLSRSTGRKRLPDKQKIRIIGFFFENRQIYSLKWKKNLQMVDLGYIFIYVQIQL